MLAFQEGGKPENFSKNPRSKAETNNKLNLHVAVGRNRTRITLVEGEHSHHCSSAEAGYKVTHKIKSQETVD